MSATYPELTNTQFPDKIDTLNNFVDITLTTLPLAQEYYRRYNLGDIEGAQEILNDNPDLKYSYIGASTLNPIIDAVKAIQLFYTQDVQEYLVNIVQHKGDFSATTKYKKYNTVSYLHNSALETFMCINHDTPIGTLPTNLTYWIPLTMRGKQGESGIGLSAYGSWNPVVIYPKNAMVAFNNALWGSLIENTDIAPSNTATSTWYKIIEFSADLLFFNDTTTSTSYQIVVNNGSIYLKSDTMQIDIALKSDVEEVMDLANQAFQSASDGKQKIATAITGKGVPTSSGDTFQKMADNIEAIETDPSIGTTDAVASDILAPKKAISKGELLTGTMPDRGTVNHSLPINGSYTIPAGKHSGSGKVTQSIPTKAAQTYTPSTSNQTIAAGQYLNGAQTIKGDANLIPTNILSGKSIFGVAGNVVAGKRFASGVSAPGGNKSFAFANDSGSYRFNSLIVSGLNFKPNIIVAQIPVSSASIIFTTIYTKSLILPERCFLFRTENTSYTQIVERTTCLCIANALDGYVDNSGFCIPALAQSENTIYWVAYE